MCNDSFLSCRSANVPGSSNMAAGSNRRLQQTQHQVDEVKLMILVSSSSCRKPMQLEGMFFLKQFSLRYMKGKQREVPSVQTLAAVFLLEDLA